MHLTLMYVPEGMYWNVHKSTICIGPKLETTYMFISSRMGRLTGPFTQMYLIQQE